MPKKKGRVHIEHRYTMCYSTCRLVHAYRFQVKNMRVYSALLTLYPPNYSLWIFTHLKLCLADAIHNFKWVKIIQIWQNEDQLY